MALPSGTATTYDQVGIREELSDTVYDISPAETPFLSMTAQVTVENTLFEWQTHDLNATSTAGALDGDDAPGNSYTATTKLNNRTHIRTRDARVSGSGRSVNTAGRNDDLDTQAMYRATEIKRDMEAVLLDNNAKVTGNSSTARETAGIVSWLATNTDAVGADPTGDGTDAATNGTQRQFTEDQLKTVLLGCWDNGGMPDCIMVGGYNRQIASGFSDGRTVQQRAEDDTLRATFSIYESDFGQLKIIPNRFQRARDALVLQSDMFAVGFLPGRNMLSFDIAKTGDSDARQVVCEFGLLSYQEKASGIVRDLTTS